MPERTLSRDMNRMGSKLLQCSTDAFSRKDSESDRRIARTGVGAKLFRRDKENLMTQFLQVLPSLSERTHDAIDLWMPRISGDRDLHGSLL